MAPQTNQQWQNEILARIREDARVDDKPDAQPDDLPEVLEALAAAAEAFGNAFGAHVNLIAGYGEFCGWDQEEEDVERALGSFSDRVRRTFMVRSRRPRATFPPRNEVIATLSAVVGHLAEAEALLCGLARLEGQERETIPEAIAREMDAE